jgi:hypothetical protein
MTWTSIVHQKLSAPKKLQKHSKEMTTRTQTHLKANRAMPTQIQDLLKPDTIVKNEYGSEQKHNPRFIIGYWSIKGLAAPIRMLLSAAQINHWVVLYDVKEKGEDGWDTASWMNDKERLGADYPLINLPYLVDCAAGSVMCQTNAILSYLGRELKMLGHTPWQTCQCEELLCEIMDLRNHIVGFAYTGDEPASAFHNDANILLKKADHHFKKLERHLMLQYPNTRKRTILQDELDTVQFHKNSVCHLVGGQFSAPDFHLWEMLDQYQSLCKYLDQPNCLGDACTYSDQLSQIQSGSSISSKSSIYPFLKEFYTSFISLSANQAYVSQYGLNGANKPDSIHIPHNNPFARFGSDPQTLGKYTRGQETPWKCRGVVTNTYSRIDTGIPGLFEEPHTIAEKKCKHNNINT